VGVRIVISEPTTGGAQTGNLRQAAQWARYLEALGHDVALRQGGSDPAADVLIALNASKSHGPIAAFRAAHPGSPIVVVLTGTDLYPALDEDAIASLRMADRIVALQPRARDQVPAEFQDRLSVIVQGVEHSRPQGTVKTTDTFDIAVVAHLRDVKDPLRAATASRLLPPSSRIRIRQVGAILDPRYRELVAREQSENHRFTWLGELGPEATFALIASCRLVVVSSFFEGGARVIGESVVAGTPVLAARNDSSCSLLGDDYSGLYEAGNTEELARLLQRAESDAAFLEELRERIQPLAPTFDPRREEEALRALIDGLQRCVS